MNEPIQIYHAYIERYGEVEGKVNFIQYAYFMAECTDFPNCLEWCEIVRMINDGEI